MRGLLPQHQGGHTQREVGAGETSGPGHDNDDDDDDDDGDDDSPAHAVNVWLPEELIAAVTHTVQLRELGPDVRLLIADDAINKYCYSLTCHSCPCIPAGQS